MIGGCNETGTQLKSVKRYDPSTGEWMSLPSMKMKRAYLGAAILGDHLYAVGGWNEFDETLASVERFCLQTVS